MYVNLLQFHSSFHVFLNYSSRRRTGKRYNWNSRVHFDCWMPTEWILYSVRSLINIIKILSAPTPLRYLSSDLSKWKRLYLYGFIAIRSLRPNGCQSTVRQYNKQNLHENTKHFEPRGIYFKGVATSGKFTRNLCVDCLFLSRWLSAVMTDCAIN